MFYLSRNYDEEDYYRPNYQLFSHSIEEYYRPNNYISRNHELENYYRPNYHLSRDLNYQPRSYSMSALARYLP